MNANNKSQSLSLRLIRLVLLVFVSQEFSYRRVATTVQASYFDFEQYHRLDSCKDHGLVARETLELFQEDCIAFCGENTMEAFDYADLEEDADYVIRNTVCKCFEYGQSEAAPKKLTFECRTSAEVWDKQKPLMKCEDDYGIVSLSTCEDYCKRIDPKAFSFQGFKGSSQCECGGIPVCSDVAIYASTATRSAAAVSTALTLVAGCLLALLS